MADRYTKKFEKKGYYLSSFYSDSDFEKCDEFEFVDVYEDLLKSIIRGEATLDDKFKSKYANEAIFLKLKKTYHFKLRDLVAFLEKEKFKDEEITMADLEDDLYYVLNFKINDKYIFDRYFLDDLNIKDDPFLENEDNIIKIFFKYLEKDYTNGLFSNVYDSIVMLNDFIRQNELPRKERNYKDNTLALILFFMHDSIDSIRNIMDRNEARKFYFDNLEMLSDKDNFYGMKELGFYYYCGDDGKNVDYKKAEKLFLKAINLKADPYLANVLGYIYYYGKGNNGIPDYDKAFKYFSVAYLSGGLFEAAYKLSDCFKHGYGTTKDEKTAFRLVSQIYEQNLYYYFETDDSKYADVALRVGSFLKDGVGTDKDLKMAYIYFLRARTAIKSRINCIYYVGDIGLANSINKSIFSIKEELKYGDRLINEKYHGYILKDYENDLGENSVFETDVKVIDDKCFKLFIKPKEEIDKIKYVDILVEEYSFNERVKELEFVIETKDSIVEKDIKALENNRILKMQVNSDTIIFTIEFGKKEKIIGFNVNEIVYIPKSMKDIHKNYHIVSVVFNDGGKLYDYIDPKKSASVGDKVIVGTYDGGSKEVKVVEVKDVYEDELSLPLNKMSSIK